jgi:hypothetical protein
MIAMSEMRLARVLSLGSVLSMLLGCMEAADRDVQSRLLPRKLHIGSFYAEGRCNSLLDLSYQGGFVFDLQADTLQEVQEQGLSFFKNLHSENTDRSNYYFSGQWKPTPIGPEAYSEGSILNLHCAEGSPMWPREIRSALEQPGSYYQSSGQRGLFVIPRLGLVVASGSDR